MNAALSINNVAVTGGRLNLVNANGATFGQNGSLITATVSAAPSWFASNYPLPNPGFSGVRTPNAGTSVAANTFTFHPINLSYPLSVNQFLVGLSCSSIAGNGTTSGGGSNFLHYGFALYSRTGTTMTRLSSLVLNVGIGFSTSSGTWTLSTWEGASTVTPFTTTALSKSGLNTFLTGLRLLTASGFNGTLAASEYHMAQFFYTRSGTASATGAEFTWTMPIQRQLSVAAALGLPMGGGAGLMEFLRATFTTTNPLTVPEAMFTASFATSVLQTGGAIESQSGLAWNFMRAT